MVAIESIQYYSEVCDSPDQFRFSGSVDLRVKVLEPDPTDAILRQNIYSLKLLNVNHYTISTINDDRMFEYDTDEVTIKKGNNSEEYVLHFMNAFTEISISFSGVKNKFLESTVAL